MTASAFFAIVKLLQQQQQQLSFDFHHFSSSLCSYVAVTASFYLKLLGLSILEFFVE